MDKGHTVKEFAAAKAVSESTVRRMIRDGQIDFSYFRGCVRIFERDSQHSSHLSGANSYLASKNVKEVNK